MVTQTYQTLTVTIQNDPNYNLNSTDNVATYDAQYGVVAGTRPTTKHGVIVTKDEKRLHSVLLAGYAGTTDIHETSVATLVKDPTVLAVCVSNKVFGLGLPALGLLWETEADTATCFQIFNWRDGFIVHGELAITMLSHEGVIMWQFSGADIFVTTGSTPALELYKDTVVIRDWQGRTYSLNASGQEISSKASQAW